MNTSPAAQNANRFLSDGARLAGSCSRLTRETSGLGNARQPVPFISPSRWRANKQAYGKLMWQGLPWPDQAGSAVLRRP